MLQTKISIVYATIIALAVVIGYLLTGVVTHLEKAVTMPLYQIILIMRLPET